MKRHIFVSLIFINAFASASNLDYLDPTKLQTRTTAKIQQDAATRIVQKYLRQVTVEVNPLLFNNNKDMFSLRTSEQRDYLHIRASSGVAAVWGFNYYLKQYCKSQIAWQVKRVDIPNPLPEVDEAVVANDRFRYHQNVCTASYSFVWWKPIEWIDHIEWMALNGINIALAPIAQEKAWAHIYQQLGMTQEEIDDHFTGPAFLSWLRMGNMRGWGGPLVKSWHDSQNNIQNEVLGAMFELGMIPILPAFNGHVPRAFARLYPNTTFLTVKKWNRFSEYHCCGLFLHPSDPLFQEIGKRFLMETSMETGINHIYTADPFNEIIVQPWSTDLIRSTALAIFTTLEQFDTDAVWLMQNWMFVSNPQVWTKPNVKSFLTSVPTGRILVLDLQSEQFPQYDVYDQYYGQPFIWCMLHNFGGTLGMFGNLETINKDVYEVRSRTNSSMVGIGLTPEGINQNYVVYDLMLESAWRQEPVADVDGWLEEYAERRYGCNATATAWRYLHKSVYSFHTKDRLHGQYAITRRPSFKINPWAWYKSHDLIEAWRRFVFASKDCNSPGFQHDLIDVGRQVLQYRGEQLYMNVARDWENWYSSSWAFNSSSTMYLDIMNDMAKLLGLNDDFNLRKWLASARSFGVDEAEAHSYEANARNQITLWGPNGEISDYACKQWSEMFQYYYAPRWQAFLNAAMTIKLRGEYFDEETVQKLITATVEKDFMTVEIQPLPVGWHYLYNHTSLSLALYEKWSVVPGLEDLPLQSKDINIFYPTVVNIP